MGRRFSHRINVKIDFYCLDLKCFGTILNISGNGMLISSDSIDFPLKSQFIIHIPLQNKEVKVDVNVIRLLKSNGYYDFMGVEIKNPPGKYIAFVEDLKRHKKFIPRMNIIINSN